MSLTSNLPRLRAWLEAQPGFDPLYMRDLLTQWKAQYPPPHTVPGSVPPLAGMAMLYACRITIADKCEDRFALYQTVAGTHTSLETMDLNEFTVAQLAIILAQRDALARGRAEHYNEYELDATTEDADFMSLWLPKAFRFTGGSFNIAPRFGYAYAVGGADGGFIVDNVLYQCRTTTRGMNEDWFIQSVLYALLDIDDMHEISGIAFVMPRQQTTHFVELDGLFRRGYPPWEMRRLFGEYLEV